MFLRMLYRNHPQVSLYEKGPKMGGGLKARHWCLKDTATYQQTNKAAGEFNWENALMAYAARDSNSSLQLHLGLH